MKELKGREFFNLTVKGLPLQQLCLMKINSSHE